MVALEAAPVDESVDRTETTAAIESLIVADLGRGSSRAYLLERVAGAFRFVARAEGPTTAEAPLEDLSAGWIQLLRQLEWETGRRLVERDRVMTPQSDRGDGVDAMAVCATLVDPLRVAVLDTGSGPTSSAVAAAVRRTFSRILHISAPHGKKDMGWAANQTEILRGFQPEIVILSLGTPAATERLGAAQRLIQMLKTSGVLDEITSALVLADGALADQALGVFSTKTNVRQAEPDAEHAVMTALQVERDLQQRYQQRSTTQDFALVADQAIGEVVVRANAVDLANRFIARAFNRHVITIGIDDGTHVHWGSAGGGALNVVPHLDLHTGIVNLTTREVAEAVRWLPFATETDEPLTWTLNRALRPWTTAVTHRDLVIEQALTRQIARRALADLARAYPTSLTGADLVIGGPSFGKWDQPGIAALVLLDSLDVIPRHGVIDLALDQDGLMAVTGTVGTLAPPLASDVFEYDGLSHLGSAIIIGGTPKEGEIACRGEIHYDGGGMASFEVASGDLKVLPVQAGATATVALRPEKKFSIGEHPVGKPVTLSEERRIIGGLVGVIIDARGRPLPMGTQPDATMTRWLNAVTIHGQGVSS